MTMTNIAVADDSEVIRNLIEEIIRYEPDLALVGSFESGPEIVAWTRDGGRADIYLIDMRLPGLSGTATIRAIRRFVPDARVIAFSASAQESSVNSALEAGANQYIVKDSSLTELLTALQTGDGDVDPGEPGDAPVAGAAQSVEEVAASAAVDRATRAARHGFTVMVVDDHDIVRDTTAALLESRGFNTACFATADAALGWIESGGNPEAALVDLRLGGSNDTSFIERLRAALPAAAIFLHSGASNAEGAEVVESMRLDGFIAKGELSASGLETALDALVARRRAAD